MNATAFSQVLGYNREESSLSTAWNDTPSVRDGTLDEYATRAMTNVLERRAITTNTFRPAIDNDKEHVEISSPVRNERNSVVDVPDLFKPRKVAGRSVATLQEWECLIVAFDDSVITARMKDLTRPGSFEDVGHIPVDEVDPRDRDRIKIGAIFHLIIGFTIRASSRRRETLIYFRRHLPQSKRNAHRLVSLLRATRDDVD